MYSAIENIDISMEMGTVATLGRLSRSCGRTRTTEGIERCLIPISERCLSIPSSNSYTSVLRLRTSNSNISQLVKEPTFEKRPLHLREQQRRGRQPPSHSQITFGGSRKQPTHGRLRRASPQPATVSLRTLQRIGMLELSEPNELPLNCGEMI